MMWAVHTWKRRANNQCKPVSLNSNVLEPASCRSNTMRSHCAEESNHEFDMSPSKRHKSGSKGEKCRAVEASTSPSHAKKGRTKEPQRPYTKISSHPEPIAVETSIGAQCITEIPSSLVAFKTDKLSDKNLQLA